MIYFFVSVGATSSLLIFVNMGPGFWSKSKTLEMMMRKRKLSAAVNRMNRSREQHVEFRVCPPNMDCFLLLFLQPRSKTFVFPTMPPFQVSMLPLL